MSKTNQGIAVWIIEDDPKYRDTICTLLDRTKGLVCANSFHNCEKAIATLQAGDSEVAPDVILLDVNLPGISGLEGIGSLKALAPQSQIIMLTIHDDATTIYDALRAGASGYLLKNTPIEQMITAITEASEGGLFMQQEVAQKVQEFFFKMGPKIDYKLSPREMDVLKEMAEGFTQKQIAERLYIAPNTVNTHVQRIYDKLHVNSNVEAVAKALRERLID